MPTQNFLSTDFFLLSSEEETRKVLLSLPDHYATITLLKESTVLHSTRFLVENTEKQLQHYIDVSVLTLNDQHVLVKLHGSYTNGKSFHSDPELWQALKQFESALSLLQEKGEKLAVEAKRSSIPEKKASFFSQAFFSLFARSI
jgi:hypothetical protein